MTSVQRYRPDIDGLRAIAILMVVGCHIGMPGMAGGFAGVDVFFGISGYLITGLLVREQLDSGRIGIAEFYARRVRRLLPALGVVIAVTLLSGFAVLLPDDQVALARSSLASVAFAANFHFRAIPQNYFAEVSALRPLQHLWTLAVEEQFYLLWPLVLAVLAQLGARSKYGARRVIAVALVAGGLSSLALSIAFSTSHPTFAFYLLPARAWELGAGCLLALAPAIPVRWAWVLAPLGLIAIALTTLMFDGAMPFPSFYALLPVIGVMALIAGGGAVPDGAVSRMLSSRPFVGLGKVSYSWYLWHWPLLAFARNLWGTEPALMRDAAIAALALALAVITWRWIETPVRAREVVTFRTTRGALVGGTAILSICALLSYALLAWGHRPLRTGSILAQYHAVRGHTARDFPFCDGKHHSARCEVGAPTAAPEILLWGDSHAVHLTWGIDLAARSLGLKVVVRTMGDCNLGGHSAAVRLTSGLWSDCAAFNDAVLASIPQLRRDNDLRGVVIAGSWSQERGGWKRQIEAQVNTLRHFGLRVLLVHDVPILPPDFVVCLVRRSADACALPRAEVDGHASAADAVLTRIAAGSPEVRTWSPLDALCPGNRCVAVIGGRLLYRNRDHLSIEGSAFLAPTMTPMLRWLAEAPSKR